MENKENENNANVVFTENEDEISLTETECAEGVFEKVKAQKQKEKEEKEKKPAVQQAYEWVESFALALACMVLLFLFFFKYVTVDGHSMEDTLENGQKLIITGVGGYENGDIVVICEPGTNKPLVKRLIARGGQTVNIDFETWTVYVDGVALDEPYIKREINANMKRDQFTGPITVPEGYVFVMGDNRNRSSDSRHFGCIDERAILGKVLLRVTPFAEFGPVD